MSLRWARDASSVPLLFPVAGPSPAGVPSDRPGMALELIRWDVWQEDHQKEGEAEHGNLIIHGTLHRAGKVLGCRCCRRFRQRWGNGGRNRSLAARGRDSGILFIG